MTENVTNELLLETLKAIQAKVADDIADLKTDMRGVKGHMAAFMQQLGAKRVTESLHGVLGCAISGLERDTAIRERRAYLNDGAAISRPHSPKCGERAVYRA